MKASVLTKFGPPDVLQLREVAKPTPGDKDVIVRVHAASVGFSDRLVRNLAAVSPRHFNMPLLFWLLTKLTFGFRKPKVSILGNEFAGEVDAVGSAVERFKPGDAVFGYCGPRMGAYAEYLRIAEDGMLTAKPANMSYERAAAIPYTALIALGLLRKAKVKPGERVLVVGASGGIGPAALQLAKLHFGAETAGVCGTAGLDYIRSLGADLAVDYTREDFTARPETYDVIIDVLGRSSFFRCRHVLKPRGRIIFASFKLKHLLQALWTALASDRKAICALVPEKPADLAFLRELIEAGKLTAIIDQTYPLAQAAEAHRHAESHTKAGAIIITPQSR